MKEQPLPEGYEQVTAERNITAGQAWETPVPPPLLLPRKRHAAEHRQAGLRTVRRRLAERIPGVDGAHLCRRYAIIVPLVETADGYSFLYEVRSTRLNRHAGEISFPGGAAEADEYPLDTAIRETGEELLIAPDQLEIWGAGDMLVMPFNVILYPFFAKLSGYTGTFNEEVDHVFTIPLSWLDDHPPQIYENTILNVPTDDFPYEKIPGGQNYHWASGKNPVCFYEYGDHVVWGMTGRITCTAVRLLKEAGLF